MSPFKDWFKASTILGLFGITFGLLIFLSRRELWSRGRYNPPKSLSEAIFDDLGFRLLDAARYFTRGIQSVLASRAAVLAIATAATLAIWLAAVEF